MDRQKLAACCLLIAFQIVAFIAALLLFVGFGFFAGWPVTKVQPLVAIGITLLLPFAAGRRFPELDLKLRVLSAATFSAILGLALFIGTSVVDFTCDGQGYHGTGLYQLLDGWNPVREPDRAEAPQAPQRDVMIHFAKGCWFSAAALCKLVGNVEAGKATALLLIAATFLLALYAALKYSILSHAKSIILSALVALNPISLNQCLSYYVDGQLASLFIILVLTSCLLLRERGPINLALIALTIVLLINVKLTALVYVCVFGAVFAIALFVLKQRQALPSLIGAYAIGALLALGVGYNPYVTNFQKTGNPLHPFSVRSPEPVFDKIFEVHQKPVTFRGRNRFDTLARSIFGRCDNRYDEAAQVFTGGPLKIPFTVGADELEWFEKVDVRVCGWGPLTSGILLIALAGLLIGKQPHRQFLLALIICILVTIFVIPHPWYARYAPQLWLLPVLVLTACWLGQNRWHRGIAAILATLMFINLAMVSLPCFRSSYLITQRLRSQLHWLAAQNRVHTVAFGDYQFNRARFQEYGIRYQAVEILPPGAKQMTLAGDTSSKTLVLLEE